MGIISSNKTLSTDTISCGESFNVRLSLTSAPDILSYPADIVLVLDRSGSMEGEALAELKLGANAFIDTIYEATGGENGHLGAGSRIAVVSFSTIASEDTRLTTDVAELKAAVNNLRAGGFTNHTNAFVKATDILDTASTNDRFMVLFTDGMPSTGGSPGPAAAAARARGITIYAVGLAGNGGLDVPSLENWASKPASAYVIIAPTPQELEELFENLARDITKPGATNIVLMDRVNGCFQITGISGPTKGTAAIIDGGVQWSISELGVTETEGAYLEFTVTHVGDCPGVVEVNESLNYSDAEGNVVSFPSPTVLVDCGRIVVPEPCPDPVDIPVSGCQNTVTVDAGDVALESLGCIIQVNVTLRNVCPGRRVALAAVLTERVGVGEEATRGVKILTIPAHSQPGCRDVEVRCIKFVLPGEDIQCFQRDLQIRFIANYMDSSFVCCPDLV